MQSRRRTPVIPEPPWRWRRWPIACGSSSCASMLLEANTEITADKVSKILESGVVELSVFFPERDDVGTVISQTLRRDSITSPSEALIEIYRKLRPGDPPTLDTATALFQGMFFDPRKYD